MKNKPKIIITGIGGFVGAYATAHFFSQGFEVYGFDRHGSTLPNTTTKIIDILNSEAVDQFIREVRPTHLLHLAAQSSVKKSWDEPELTYQVNVNGTKNILESIRKYAPLCINLIVSSAEIYGIPKEVPITETTPLNPPNPYATSRLEQEKLCLYYQDTHHLKIIIARSFPHTGPGQTDQFVCSNFAKQIAQIETKQQPPILSVGNLDAKRDFTDVRDIVRAYHLLITNQNASGVYNICSGKSISINDILQTLLSFSKTKITIKQDPTKMRPSDIPNMLGDNIKITQLTKWKPTIPLDQTLKEMLEYWRKELQAPKDY